ncbi:MAG: uroporphyrinogen decarboxylase family protein [Thermoproteota archaeon]
MLTSRERCLRAVQHEEVDRVPLVLRIRPEPYEKLVDALGIERGEGEYYRVCKSLGIDVLGAPGIELHSPLEPEQSTQLDEEGGWPVGRKGRFEIHCNIWRVETIWAPDHTYTYTYHRHPFSSLEDLEDFDWPTVVEQDQSKIIKFRHRYENYYVGSGSIQAFETAWKMTGMQRFLVGMIRNDTLITRILDELFRISTQQAILAAEAGVDFIYNGDDVGSENNMIVSPELWRRHLKPRYAAMFREIRRRGAFVMFHSDGWIEPIIPDLIEVGVNVLNPIQPECMDPAKLKKMFGDKLCFDGTIGVQSILPHGTPEQVAHEVRHRIRTCGPTGLILGPTHSMQPDVPVSNILAMYETARSTPLR